MGIIRVERIFWKLNLSGTHLDIPIRRMLLEKSYHLSKPKYTQSNTSHNLTHEQWKYYTQKLLIHSPVAKRVAQLSLNEMSFIPIGPKVTVLWLHWYCSEEISRLDMIDSGLRKCRKSQS